MWVPGKTLNCLNIFKISNQFNSVLSHVVFIVVFYKRTSFKTFQFGVCAYLFKVKSKIPDFERGKTKIVTTPVRSARLTRQEYIEYISRI